MEVQRYKNEGYVGDMVRDGGGRWVLYTDHDDALAAKDAEIAGLKAKLAALAPFLDERGEPRKVVGTLPVTADGAIVIDEPVYHSTKGAMYLWKDGNGTWRAKPWLSDYKNAAPLSECYSTEAAALASRGGGKEGV